ncbi:hypothetical protein JCM16775_0061 [Leptotrichia hofstadii]|uniref:Uncharacterized protein n=1 Tax=Leptotrichia hofstadii TaxID=157688 RepID=A0A510JE68_9FUSO|nr:hypothetical protein JCM16775_0061 [Leptotrichia hofstadii]
MNPIPKLNMVTYINNKGIKKLDIPIFCFVNKITINTAIKEKIKFTNPNKVLESGKIYLGR